MADYDIIVVGAGWHGLVVAKTYLELHPGVKFTLLEAEDTCGGTLSAGHLYPGLKSNNLLDTYEYPDFPMSPETYGVQPGQHIPGTVLNRYLTDFAKHFGFHDRIKFATRVEAIRPGEKDKWEVITTTSKDAKVATQTLKTKKIVIASGLTSQPNFPQYAGAETFGRPYFHAKDFCRNGQTVNMAKRVVVGGGKSAMDVAYAYAEAGMHVDMVIRKEGNGPVWISHPWVMGKSKRLEKLLSVRFLTWFSPCPFGGAGGWGWVRNFLHGTKVGRFLVDKFWANLGGEVIEVNGYKSHPELKKLQPWNDSFWMVKDGKINVHVADVDRLTKGTVHLNDSTELKDVDALICATGWRKDSGIRYEQFGVAGIGLTEPKPEQVRLAAEADQEVFRRFPELKGQPQLNFTPKGDPYRLYKFIVPPAFIQSRNIAFAGMVSSVSTATAANAQALWISAFFDGKLDRMPQSMEEVTKEVMLHTQWNKWRHPTGYGASLPDIVFDALPYIDLLLKDLGLKTNRKSSTWAEVFEP